MNFDDFLKILGEFGTYQKQRCALICVVAFYSVISTLGVVFYGAEPFHHCKIPQERLEYVSRTYGNLSKEQLLDMNVPYTKYGKRNGCALYRMDITLTNGSIPVFQNITAANSSTSGILQRLMTTSLESDVEYAQTVNLTTSSDSLWNSTVWKSQETYPCPVGRYYSTDEYQATIVSEFDLTCDNAWQLSTCSSVFFGGKLVAILVSGILSDRFGRRPIFLGSVVVLAASGIGLAFSPNMAVFCILYVIQGASDSSMYISLYTMGMELVGTKYRKLIGMGMAISFGLGHTLLAVEAYFLRNWRYLALVACSPAVIIIFFYFVFNESVRWLLSRGRHKEAKRIITKAARVNKVKLEEDTWERLLKEGDEEKQTKTHSQLDLFRTWKRTVLTFKLAFCRLSFAVAYYGLALNAQGLGGNIYLNFALLGAADLPIVVLSSIILDKTGRQKLLVSTLFFGGLACIASGLIPKDFPWLVIVSAVAGKMLICAAGALNDLVVSEVFPTVIRHTGLSFCVSFGRMGGVLASQILFLKTIYQPLPFIILGSLAITGGFVSFFLPETRGKPLLQTLEAWDVELNGKSLKNQAQQDESDADEVELENMKSDQIATG